MHRLLVIAALLVLAGPAARPANAQEAVDSASAGPTAVTLRPGDVVKIEIWREPDLSGNFLIDRSGMVVLPLLGEQQASGVPIDELRDRLIESYRVHLRNPAINITPLRRINVLGEVRTPGLYPVDPTITLAGVIAMAGGATPTGDLNRVRILRDDQVIRQRIGVGETLAGADVRSGDQVVVDRRSWFDRNSTFLVSALLSVTGIVVSIINKN